MSREYIQHLPIPNPTFSYKSTLHNFFSDTGGGGWRQRAAGAAAGSLAAARGKGSWAAARGVS